MTASEQGKYPDFFEDHSLDPLAAATGSQVSKTAAKTKKKAGFYLSEELLERFNRCFHRMKLDGAPIENKSALLEKALSFALDDLEKGQKSKLRAMFDRGAR
jgi:hypothetical protein